MSRRTVAAVQEHSRATGEVREFLEELAKYADENGRVCIVDELTGKHTHYTITPGGIALDERRADA